MIKKLFTIDDFAVALISSLGYGYGETISRLSGWPKAACTAASFVLGIAAEELISRIVFSPSVQKKKEDKFISENLRDYRIAVNFVKMLFEHRYHKLMK